ncbi:uncharacterized protein LOC106088080 [Stomoxys calcitrans]|uniref:SKA complex subunit 1 n=1 Tax=Stomoxys calcitrans TaxID=35570 RepID=A0A1I8NPI3_STOCA|nr:uncharacterized protein LOC106088080 [Stomoxys calcitrans]
MEDIGDFFNINERKIARLNDFIALSLRRKNISKELQGLADQATVIRDQLVVAHESMLTEMNKLEDDFTMVMSEMRKKQILIMQFIIEEKERKIKEAEEEDKKVQLLLSCGKSKGATGSAIKKSASKSAVKLLGSNLARLNLNHHGSITPKIKIKDYKQSPLVQKKISPIPIQFEEFDVQIAQKDFDKIPKYMCGRETLDQLNSFLETVIIPCFNEKYKLIHKQRQGLRSNDLELWKMFNEQSHYLPGKHFITLGDITRVLNKMLDKKTQNRLTMLRHVGILQEQRIKQTVCYVWSYNG